MRYFTLSEARQYLRKQYGMQYSMSALHKYRAEGTGPRCVKLAGKYWYRDKDIDAWVASAEPIRHCSVADRMVSK